MTTEDQWKTPQTSEQKQAKLEVLEEAINRICPACKSGIARPGGTQILQHRLPGKTGETGEIVECKAGPLHVMMLEIKDAPCKG